MLKETMDYKLKMIKEFFGKEFEGTEEETIKFINEHDEMLRQAIDNTFKFMNRVMDAKVFFIHENGEEEGDIIIANTEEEAITHYSQVLEGAMLLTEKELVAEELDKDEDYLYVDEALVPEGDLHMWESFEEDVDGETKVAYKVRLVYAVDYYLSHTGESIPVIMV